jgi:hypothetical protein
MDVDLDTVETLKQLSKNKTHVDDNIVNNSEIQQLVCALLTGETVNVIAQMIFCMDRLKQALWVQFLLQIEENSKYLTQRKLSYLSDTSYTGLVNFEWDSVVGEMIDINPQLVEVLLAVSTSRKHMSSSEHYSLLSKELELIYGILMKRRFKDLSRIQRMVAMTLADEKVHQKVYIVCVSDDFVHLCLFI